jgi:hypothetical protein
VKEEDKRRVDHINPDKLDTPEDRALFRALNNYVANQDKESPTEQDDELG